MTAGQFNAWLTVMEYNDSEASRQLGKSRNTIVKYKKVGTPKLVDLACMALTHGLTKDSWRDVFPKRKGI